MSNFDTTAEEQAEQEFAAAFTSDESADDGAPADEAASTEETYDESFSQDDESPSGSDDAPQSSAPVQEETEDDKGESAKKELTLEEKAHGYDSMFGRLEKERAQRAQLEEELNRIRSHQAAAPVDEPAPDAPAQQDEPASNFEVPDELKDDLSAVEKEDPQLAALFKEDSADGQRLRSVLEDYGQDMALIQANAVHSARQVQEQGQAITQTMTKSAEEAHNAAIFAAVEGYEDLTTNPERKAENQAYHQELRSWISQQPYAEATQKFEVIEKGSAHQVAALLNEFNATRESAVSQGAKAQDDAEAALAVPSKPSPLPKSKGSKDDFDAGWDD